MDIKRVVGFSGGADSQAAALVIRQRFPAEDILLMNSNAGGNEHPLTDAFVRWYSETIFPVTVVRPLIRDLGGVGSRCAATAARREEFGGDDQELTFDALAYIKGRFPSRTAQFCTQFLKLAPQKRWCEENLRSKGIDFERYIGVRRDESEDRKCAKDVEWDDYFECQVWRPIASWSKKMVFAFLKEHGEEVNPLYKMGFNRVGCAPCINSGKDDIRNWAARFPEMIDKIREWEKKVGYTFFGPCVPGLVMNWVDEVVEWSRTARGGVQLTMAFEEADAETGQCVSKYGLCE